MTTTTPNLGLKSWTTGDSFHIQDYDDNFTRLDQQPGIFLCTSTTRPTTWGAAQAGMFIFEKDKLLLWRWTGAAWLRQWPKGFLASASRTTAFSTTSTTPVSALSVSVPVPNNNGGRRTLIVVEGDNIQNTQGLSQVQIVRDGATALHSWTVQGSTGAAAIDQPRPIPFVAIDSPTPDATHTYDIFLGAVLGFGGTTSVAASTTHPLVISAIEV